MHGKATADAGALAVAERLPGIDRPRRLGLAAEILRIERIGIGPPDAGIAMQRHHQNGDEGVLPKLVLAADGFIAERRDAIGRRRRPQPQGFLQNLCNVSELGDLLVGWPRIEIWTENAINLLISLPEHLGVLEQRVDRA